MPLSAAVTLAIAVICGTPVPVTMRVVQIDPGPIPTLTPSTPASARATAAAAGGDVAADHLDRWVLRLDHLYPLDHVARVAVGGVDHQHVHTGAHQGLYPVVGVGAGANRGADPQLAVGVLAGQGEALGLVEVLHGDHAAQVEVVVDHEDFLDAMLVQQPLHFAPGWRPP